MKKIKTAPYAPTEFIVTKSENDRAVFEIYPFEPGYAITLAHPIKRLILSSAVGSAPIAVKIEGAAHEFDSVRGVVEDVARLIVNLKNIRFKITNGEDRIELVASFRGAKEVKGADLAAEGVEVVTPDAHFASINEDGELKISIILEKGMGYIPSEEIRDLVPEGYLPLDGIFGPVRKANYSIEKMLVEDNPNFEKIVFEIATYGQIDPKEVFRSGVATLFKQTEILSSALGVANESSFGIKGEEADERLKTLLSKVEDVGFSTRSYNCLFNSKIVYLGEVALMDESQLSRLKNLGKKSLDEIKERLAQLGYPVTERLPEDLAQKLRARISELKGTSL
ncbi:MAG: DNA-directed RNA polymerase subunit alpha [Helicobacteraceae bacterium]|jgi:DNA-directed RNA polymerase subunit alpha|nr:DNA-directed RNA polymerase subunit alpha [Helicobacteraceae bacterium]